MSESFQDQLQHAETSHDGQHLHTLLEKAVFLAIHPGHLILRPFAHHYRKRYHGRYRFPRTVFLFDLFLAGVAAGLALTALLFFLIHPQDLSERVFLEAGVAPTQEIMVGAPSTLVIRYTNGTGKPLENAKLTLGFPAHFVLENVLKEEESVEGRVVFLGSLEPGATGTVKIRGTMFGNVGTPQIFRSLFTFRVEKESETFQTIAYHRFTPTRSVLSLSLDLPKTLVAFQPFTGTIHFRNTGPLPVPDFSVVPSWPEGFVQVASQPTLQDGVWKIGSLNPGDQGDLSFTGRVDRQIETIPFSFQPFFLLGEDHYRQNPLAFTVSLVSPKIRVAHSIQANSARPGGTLTGTITYENTGTEPVRELVLSLDATSPFVQKKTPVSLSVGDVEPGAFGEKTLTIPLRSSIGQSETNIYEHLTITTRASVEYTTDSKEEGQRITVSDSPIETILTTPVILQSFGRYTSEQGDQLGRGPLPPLVGEETKYWIFWTVEGTTNPLERISILGHLPEGVRFTGRQTVSQGEAVSYDLNDRSITWTAPSVAPTFPPGSKVIGIAFEVGITPEQNQVGTSPKLLEDVRLSAADQTTGVIVSASGSAVTTDLPGDSLAAGLGTVQL
ncbi:MAG TPA: hypothetical protein VJB99_04760 [Patescibacteria group bacterium]|nr:hypothetical protein [Patescibacteria group bacterium]